MSMNKEFLKVLNFFAKKYGTNISSVIYAGENCPEYLGCSYDSSFIQVRLSTWNYLVFYGF